MSASEQLPLAPDVEGIFLRFVERANGSGREPDSADPILLSRVRAPRPASSIQSLDIDELLESSPSPAELEVVPDVRRILEPPPSVVEGSEDGQIPAREMERFVEDMQVLLRYRHFHDVSERLTELQARYPRDLLLLRRIAEFHLQADNPDQAKECLFKLSSLLFERRHFEGMRVALEQVLVLEPSNPRALKLTALLAQRKEPH